MFVMVWRKQANRLKSEKADALYIVKTCTDWHGECLLRTRPFAGRMQVERAVAVRLFRLFMEQGEQVTKSFGCIANTMKRRLDGQQLLQIGKYGFFYVRECLQGSRL